MRKSFIITGTDTEIGKTVCAAVLMAGLHDAGVAAHYYKPVQSGLIEARDTNEVQRLSGVGAQYFLPEAVALQEPLSPHRAAELEGAEMDLAALDQLPQQSPLLIEGAGGLMVPLTRDRLYIDQFKRWDLPVILCARAGLGTINHTLLSLEAIKARGIQCHGLIFIGAENEDNRRTIAEFSGAKILGVIPHLDSLTPKTLLMVFKQNFDSKDFT